jgi:hypothetical protein
MLGSVYASRHPLLVCPIYSLCSPRYARNGWGNVPRTRACSPDFNISGLQPCGSGGRHVAEGCAASLFDQIFRQNPKLVQCQQSLFLHHTEWPDRFAVKFVEDLGEAGVDGGGAAEDAFVAGEMFEAQTGGGVIVGGEEKKQEG